MIHFHIISLFPQVFSEYFSASILKKAQEKGKIQISMYDPKDFLEQSANPELKKRVDDTPYAGGPGMVLRPEPFLKSIQKAIEICKREDGKYEIIYFSPRGEMFTTDMAKDMAYASERTETLVKIHKNLQKNLQERIEKIGPGKKKESKREEENSWYEPKIQKIEKILQERKEGRKKDQKLKIENIILVAGRYEGIDSRVEEVFPGKRVSVGDYVLTGGELPAMIVVDSISRQISGVLGNSESLEEERISSGRFYTKPAVLEYGGKEYKVPKVLLSGNHAKIEVWKRENS